MDDLIKKLGLESDEAIARLAEVEREMDAGKISFVRLEGKTRLPLKPALMSQFKLEQGQTISTTMAIMILPHLIAEMEATSAIDKAKESS